MIVHHKIVLTPENINDPEVTLNWEYLELLCLDCHNREPHGKENKEDKKTIAEGLYFDEKGNVVQVAPPLKAMDRETLKTEGQTLKNTHVVSMRGVVSKAGDEGGEYQ